MFLTFLMTAIRAILATAVFFGANPARVPGRALKGMPRAAEDNPAGIFCIPGSTMELSESLRPSLSAGDQMIERALPRVSAAMEQAAVFSTREDRSNLSP